ncbi:sigma factor-like helix-turn-helix DNA-binding protein [Bacillus sp. B-jedd]|uniref:sigma factor-like helix-turn-helix DNA-binding protein n=1 Tax=Bacillus sp. B-jedd TaxID=1476857 RepID=UPI000515730C|nr:sigma factor-like helix-turn-helix DNA-binding protein [Bacillus sp. B-jedd]CEG28094.1 positive control sigma-like factor [Bacillus sp. B-jedd]
MLDLIIQYKQALADVERLKKTANEEDSKLLGGMASDLEYALEWMLTAKQPGNRRGIERRAAYEREKPFDPLIMQQHFRSMDDNLYSWDEHNQEDSTSGWDRERIEDALSVLTPREKEVYLMAKEIGLSYSQIARYLKVSKSAVQDSIRRAEGKIAKRIEGSLFCVG